MNDMLFVLLETSMKFADMLETIGVNEPVRVALTRCDGLRVLALITGSDSEVVEELFKERLGTVAGLRTLRVSGVEYTWPAERRATTQEVVVAMPVRPRRAHTRMPLPN
jgi:hypothetical protein